MNFITKDPTCWATKQQRKIRVKKPRISVQAFEMKLDLELPKNENGVAVMPALTSHHPRTIRNQICRASEITKEKTHGPHPFHFRG